MLCILCGVVYSVVSTPSPQPVISPIVESYIPTKEPIALFEKKKKPEELKTIIENQIGNSWDNYSVFVVDYTHAFSMGINEAMTYDAASVNKIPILMALYSEAQKGNIDFSRTITLQEQDRQDYGTGSIRYDPAGTTYSIQTLARLMIQKSDNTAAYLLANYIVGMDTIQSYINQWGLTQTNMETNTSSNKDMELLFDKIVHKNIVNDALSEECLNLLKDSDFEDRLPALLPKTATVYHKIGTGIGGVHDVGVVMDGDLMYYVGIFTADVGDEEQASVLLSQVSLAIYDFLKS